jgi:hypothetical protein
MACTSRVAGPGADTRLYIWHRTMHSLVYRLLRRVGLHLADNIVVCISLSICNAILVASCAHSMLFAS